MNQTQAPLKQIDILDTLKWLWPFWKTMPWRLGFLLIMTPISVAFDVYVPIVMKRIFDQMSKSQLTEDFLIEQVLFILGLGLAHFLLYFGVQSIRGATNFQLEHFFRMRISRSIVKMGRKFFYRFRVGDVTTRLIDDIAEKKLGWFACSGIFRFYQALITVIGCLYFMFQLNGTLTFVTVFPLGFIIIFYVWTSQKTTGYSQETQGAISQLNSFLTNSIDGIRVVKAYNLESKQIKRFEGFVSQQLEKEIALVKVSSLLQISYSRFSELGVLVVFLIGGWLVIHQKLSLGGLIAFNSYIFMLIWPMVDIGQFFIKGRIAGVSVDRVRELETFPSDLEVASEPLSFPQEEFCLDFKQVDFSFGAQKALTEVSFRVEPAQTVAIVGAIGAGKTLLINMIPRIIQPESGHVLLNGHPLSQYDINSLRQSIGYVSQTPSLFSDTIRNNILFGLEGISEELFFKALKVAQLESDLLLFEQGLETRIGQRGVKVSGGQKQRIAIARALLRQPKILILDDCTSALDSETESKLWEALYGYIPDIMVILVTHRASSLQKADQVIFLEQGAVFAKGHHDVLIKEVPEYQSLYS